MTNASKSALLLSTFLIGLNVPMAHAQVLTDTDTRAVDLREQELLEELAETGDVDDIIVTGTRTRRPDLSANVPTLVVGQDILEKNAFTNIADALTQIPAFGGGVDPLGDQGGNIGVNFVDFLDLGTQRTLTLINGRRFVSSNANGTGQQVDFNVIPLGLVERIETISVGGAPTYGSDAIAGTINVILRDDYEGMEATVQYGESERGDADTQQYGLLVGANSDNGRGNVTFNAEYTKNDGLLQTDRPDIFVDEPFLSEIQPGTAGFNDIDVDGDGEPDSVFRTFNAAGGAGSNVQLFTNGGIISRGATVIPSFGLGVTNGNVLAFGPDGNIQNLAAGQTIPGTSAFFAQGGFQNDFFGAVDQIRSPVERINFGSTYKYEVNDFVTIKGDLQVSNSKAAELVEQGGFQTFAFGGTSGALRFPLSNPFLNADARARLVAEGFDPDGEFVLSRFNNDLLNGARREGETSLWRFAGGIEGDFNALGDREFYYSISGVAGESNIETQTTLLNNTRFLNAIDAVVDPATGQIVCQVTLDGQPDLSGSGVSETSTDVTDCVPLNLFGAGVASPEAIDYVTQRGIFTNDIDQTVFTATLGGDIVEFPAGAAQFVIGYEARDDEALFAVGGAVEVGLGRGAATPDTGGKTSTNEYFGELYVPLVSPEMNIPFLQSAEIGGQIREVNNSQAGNFTAWTVDAAVQPIEDITFKGNITRSLRAPSLIELFQPIVTTFSFGNDPCDQQFIADGPNRAANCASAGIGAGFQSNVVNATAQGRTGGNPDLTNETADAYTISAVIQPRWVPGLNVVIDYINIEIEDLIGARTLTNNLETCFDSAPGEFPNAACDTFTRDANGQIVDFISGQLNADTADYQFLNLRADYGFDVVDAFNVFGGNTVGDYGEFSIGLNAFHAIERDIVVANVPNDNTIGSFADPRWSGTADFTWRKDGLRLFWRTFWQDRSLFSASGENFFADENDEIVTSLKGNFLHNASIAYDLSEAMNNYDKPLILQFNVNNVFDDKPGRGLRRQFGDFYQSEIVGRSYSLRVRASF